MILVLDANIIFSTLIKMSKTLDLILDYDLELYSPDFIFEEFIKYKDVISRKSGLEYSQHAELESDIPSWLTYQIPCSFHVGSYRKLSPAPHCCPPRYCRGRWGSDQAIGSEIC